MKILAKMRLMLIALCACHVLDSSAQVFFSIEEINKEEFDLAKNSPQRYVFDSFCDSVIENNNTQLIVADVRDRFERMDSLEREYYDMADFAERADEIFSTRSLIYAKQLGMYWFMMQTVHDCEVFCYDAQTAKYLGKMISPFAVSPTGIMVSQKGYDCDWLLDLHFYKRVGNSVYEAADFTTGMYRGDALYDYYFSKQNNIPLTSFFVGENLLYLSLYKNGTNDFVYLRVYLNLTI